MCHVITKTLTLQLTYQNQEENVPCDYKDFDSATDISKSEGKCAMQLQRL